MLTDDYANIGNVGRAADLNLMTSLEDHHVFAMSPRASSLAVIGPGSPIDSCHGAATPVSVKNKFTGVDHAWYPSSPTP